MRVKSICAWFDCACSASICASSDFICRASFSSPIAAIAWPRVDRIAFADVELDDGAADAPARRNDADALDGGEHRLFVGDRALKQP